MTIAWIAAGLWFVLGAVAARRVWFGWSAIVVAAGLGVTAAASSHPSGPTAAVSMAGSALALALVWQFAGGSGRVRRRREW